MAVGESFIVHMTQQWMSRLDQRSYVVRSQRWLEPRRGIATFSAPHFLSPRGGPHDRQHTTSAINLIATQCSYKPQDCWAEARIKIARMTLTINLDRNWSSFQLANSAPPLSVTDSAIAPSARMSNMVCHSVPLLQQRPNG